MLLLVCVCFFFFFEFSCVRITRRCCCCCCCFCLTLFNSHRRTTQSLISALKYTKTANKRREKEKKKRRNSLEKTISRFLVYSTSEAQKLLEFFFFFEDKDGLDRFCFLITFNCRSCYSLIFTKKKGRKKKKAEFVCTYLFNIVLYFFFF